MRRRADTSPSLTIPRSITKIVTQPPVYSHVSTYRSTGLEMSLYSPSLMVAEDGRGGPTAVFSENDQVSGKVTLDSNCHHNGRLTISVEGAFMCNAAQLPGIAGPSAPRERQKHIFLSLATTISISNSETSPSRSVFRDTFIKRRTSMTSINVSSNAADRSHSFSFPLPQGLRPGEEMPPSFSRKDSGIEEDFEVAYNVKVDWEPADPFEAPEQLFYGLEVPFVVQPDSGFQCVDASSVKPESWLEMPLKSDRPLPIRCAVTLPTSVTFSRTSSIPYFVVFTTTPRSAELAREIAADATVSVALVRQVTVTEQPSLPPTPPLTPSSEESSSDSSFRPRILRRVAKSQPRLSRQRGTSEGSITLNTRNKPLPQLPPLKRLYETKTIQSNMSIGFPKRPRQQFDSKKHHPSLEAVAALPDGLYKSKIMLNKEMLPCIDWAGISVKYYIEVSVIIGPDDFRARIPVRIV